ncbi:hypothetical protein Tco_0944370 [Tanacetum coccineum]
MRNPCCLSTDLMAKQDQIRGLFPAVKGWLDEDLDNYHLKELRCSTQCHTQMSMWIISRGVVLLILLMEYKPTEYEADKDTSQSKQNLQSSSMTFIHNTLIIPSVLDSCFISSTVSEDKRVMGEVVYTTLLCMVYEVFCIREKNCTDISEIIRKLSKRARTDTRTGECTKAGSKAMKKSNSQSNNTRSHITNCHAGNPCVYILDPTVQNLDHKEEKNGGIGFKLGERDSEAWKLHIKPIKGALKSKNREGSF